MKIFDCFMYFDEDLLLDLRLNILDKFVDKFVIVESNLTHTGNLKEFKFDINKFEKFKNKIKYFPIKNLIIDHNLKLKKNWSKHHLIDQSIRNLISDYITDASDEDWIIISDIDELPNPNVIQNFDKRKKYAFFEQELFYYKFNLKCVSEPRWYGSRLCVKKYLKSPQWLRNLRVRNQESLFNKIFNNQQILKKGGWHFSSVKKPSEIITKMKSFAHNELVKKYMLDENYIIDKIKSRKDIFERNIILEKVDLKDNFPEYLLKNKNRYLEFII